MNKKIRQTLSLLLVMAMLLSTLSPVLAVEETTDGTQTETEEIAAQAAAEEDEIGEENNTNPVEEILFDEQPVTEDDVQAAIDTYTDTGVEPVWAEAVDEAIVPEGYQRGVCGRG